MTLIFERVNDGVSKFRPGSSEPLSGSSKGEPKQKRHTLACNREFVCVCVVFFFGGGLGLVVWNLNSSGRRHFGSLMLKIRKEVLGS